MARAWAWACFALLVTFAAAENGCVGPGDDPTSCIQLMWRDCDDAFVASLVTPANEHTVQAYIREAVLVQADDGSDFTYCYSQPSDDGEEEYEACLELTNIEASNSTISLCATVTVAALDQEVDYGCWSSDAEGPGAAKCGEAGYFNYPCDYQFENVEEAAAVEESHEADGPWYISNDNCVVFSSGEVLACPTFYADTCGNSVHFSSSYGFFWMREVNLKATNPVPYTVVDDGCVYVFELSEVNSADNMEKLSVHLQVSADISAEACLQTIQYPTLEFGELQYGFPACGDSHGECKSPNSSMTWFFVTLAIICLIVLAFSFVGALTLAMRLLAKNRKKPMYITDDEELSMQEEPGIFDDVEEDDAFEF
mmetsp:Transcript_15446/g.60386  ORF Transcript_15446/g.60386 Transcript_15446/m.60386 type:complete len:368 (+) Transcript_15446:2-1105(+)